MNYLSSQTDEMTHDIERRHINRVLYAPDRIASLAFSDNK